MIENFKSFYGKSRNKIIFFFCLVLLISLIVFLFFFYKSEINTNNLNPYSSIEQTDSVSSLFLSSDKELYRLKIDGDEGIREFMNSKINDSTGRKLFPKNYGDSAILTRQTEELDLKKRHYFYQQKINNIPVFGGEVGVHTTGKSIYVLEGKMLFRDDVPKPKIEEAEVEKIALTKGKSESGSAVVATKAQLMIFNNKLMGISQNDKNHLVYRISIGSSDINSNYLKDFFVDSSDGNIIFEKTHIYDVINRQVSDCGGSRNCSLVRSEGQPKSNIVDADRLYDILGEIYSFYFDNFSRDSVDGKGVALKGNTNMNPVSLPCPNADFNSNTYTMSYCPGMLIKDISMHEFTHGVINSTAGLVYSRQSGALNESIADIFATSIDYNWTLGEGSSLGIIRDLSNPPSGRSPQPDKLFSSLYYCGSNQNRYVHINSGVGNKAFYLMTDGGDFNGCTISSIGRVRSSIIVYYALANYLRSASNYRDFYSAMLQSCNDRYASDPGVCENVKKAMEATEMDQQPVGSQTSLKCSNETAKTATCIGAPTTIPIPTVAPTSAPTPTLVPGAPTPTLTIGSSTPTVTPTPTKALYQSTITPSPTPDQYFTCVPDPKCVKSGKSIQLCPLLCTPQ